MTTKSEIKKFNIKLPNPDDSEKIAFILFNVFTEKECCEWIRLSEERGYKPALLNVGFAEVLRPDIRNNERCIIDDVDMAKKLFDRIKSYLPEIHQDYQLVGLNERLRFLRYEAGQEFKRHMDGTYQRRDGSGETSFITVQLYLNENFEGGETTFLHYIAPTRNVPCKPCTGSVLVFEHRINHEGSMLKKGRKYTVRTDVMYRPLNKAK